MRRTCVAHFGEALILCDDCGGDRANLVELRMIGALGRKQPDAEPGELGHGRKKGINEFELRARAAG
ncbi:MAG TPA: hypothetical protein VG271_12740, partial [Beijerinckiaceae bacterium]|nr:hypothetical protein [Beijerinckiaceae bacterium]